MNKVIFSIFYFLTVMFTNNLRLVQSGTFSQYAGHPDHPGMCVYKDQIVPPGEIQVDFRCVRLICSPKSWISGHLCPDSKPEFKSCTSTNPLNIQRPFPECCKKKYTCKNADGSEYQEIDF